MTTFTVTGMTLAPAQGGEHEAALLAHFTFECHPFIIAGATLLQHKATREYFIRFPGNGRMQRVALRGPENQIALKNAVLTTYQALRGAIAVTPPATASMMESVHEHPRIA